MLDIDRFLEAQDETDRLEGGFTKWNHAESELKAGVKLTHWMWYVFPQDVSLCRSPKSVYFGIQGPEEAEAYLEDDTLRYRYTRGVQYVMYHLSQGSDLESIFGEVDAKKFRSSLGLFAPFL